MAYTVLARKYRSQTFDEVVGQKPIADTLVNAIKAGRIHHGYLFTGTRGVGKTSMARILAKALNCLAADSPTAKPCLRCEACLAIGDGQDIDVIEIDAASNTGVDNIRELRSNAAFRPARSRFKIYIIDEVHMLSTGAFNALLKTLEEPPGHVKFILATTEIQKVPATIQSRCQRFNFRNIDPAQVAQQLELVVRSEHAESNPAVVQRISRLANGSMRDALSILDQLLSLSPKKLTPELLDEVLPPSVDERLLQLLGNIASGDAGAALACVDGVLAQGRTLETFCNDAIELVHALMLLRTCGAETDLVDVPASIRSEYVQLSAKFEVSHYVQMIAMLEELRRNVHYSGAGRALTDALIVRFANLSRWTPIEQIIRQAPSASAVGAMSCAPSPSRSSLPDEPGEKKKNPSPLVPAESRRAEPAKAFAARTASSMQSVAAEPLTRLPPRGSLAGQTKNVSEEVASPETSGDATPTVGIREPRPAAPAVVTSEVKSRILKNPVVQETLELFEGRVVNIERRSGGELPAPGSVAAAEAKE